MMLQMASVHFYHSKSAGDSVGNSVFWLLVYLQRQKCCSLLYLFLHQGTEQLFNLECGTSIEFVYQDSRQMNVILWVDLGQCAFMSGQKSGRLGMLSSARILLLRTFTEASRHLPADHRLKAINYSARPASMLRFHIAKGSTSPLNNKHRWRKIPKWE